jgi:hypothetical protein
MFTVIRTAQVSYEGQAIQFTYRTDKKHIKVKVKFTLEQATKAHRGSRGIDLLFL